MTGKQVWVVLGQKGEETSVLAFETEEAASDARSEREFDSKMSGQRTEYLDWEWNVFPVTLGEWW